MNEESFDKVLMEWHVLGLGHGDGEGGGGGRQAGGESRRCRLAIGGGGAARAACCRPAVECPTSELMFSGQTGTQPCCSTLAITASLRTTSQTAANMAGQLDDPCVLTYHQDPL